MDSTIHRWALISVKPGVGKSTSAIFLAQALLDAGVAPLVADADRGQTCQTWDEEAGGLPYPVVSKVSRTLDKTLPELERGRGALLVDVPQIEDHAAIARSAMLWADRWIMPIAPSVVEVTRMFRPSHGDKVRLAEYLEDVQDMREHYGRPRADVVVLLTRTNTSRATRTGPDADVRRAMAAKGIPTLNAQIKHHDHYRQIGNQRVRAIGTPYERAARELLARPYSNSTTEDAP
ncbi:hypothetical protein B7755_052115 [Streptomyces sp. NBS 14/10]|uniref:hypothetical protein n=1 Tax=Streptomyces sp. NBS 14/10 TaxID=1945643 RepID=UPI000B7F4106|nr:hypothetical protein [Streptomyces sp. NBS 14/10]KAK1176695.1 hypothetical protein B7755_052115 [Streptomyces sp. NBS 14/10]